MIEMICLNRLNVPGSLRFAIEGRDRPSLRTRLRKLPASLLLPYALQERDRLVSGNTRASGSAPVVFVRLYFAVDPVSSECLASLFGYVADQVL